jgi:hypothetical protein
MDAGDSQMAHKNKSRGHQSSAPFYKLNSGWQDAQSHVLVGFVLSEDEWVEIWGKITLVCFYPDRFLGKNRHLEMKRRRKFR